MQNLNRKSNLQSPMIRISFSILIFMLVYSSGNLPTSVLAAPTSGISHMVHGCCQSENNSLCRGNCRISGYCSLQINPGTESEWAIPGVKIEATSTDKNVGCFSLDTQIAGICQ